MATDMAAPAATAPRLAGESADAYVACGANCALGHARSTAKVGQQLGKSKTLMDRWSARWHRVARTAQWDVVLAATAQWAHIDETATVARQHAQEAAMVRQVALAKALLSHATAPGVGRIEMGRSGYRNEASHRTE
jgi:hypothetical protein